MHTHSNYSTQKPEAAFTPPKGMHRNCRLVLALLRKAGNKGITVLDFPVGMRLAPRICELRHDWNYNIHTERFRGMMVRYVLLEDLNG
jgi:hypothetical protein